MNSFKKSIILIAAMMMTACAPSATQLQKTLEENPKIVLNVIKKHPDQFFETFEQAYTDNQTIKQKEWDDKRKAQLEQDFENPIDPEISKERALVGDINAPVTIVEYGSFNCPICIEAAKSLDIIRQTYGNRVRVLYKHVVKDAPSELGARYYEAIAREDPSKAKKFHDLVFKNFDKLENQEVSFAELLEAAGADPGKIETLKDNAEITQIIEADTAEANGFGLQETPATVINGVRVKYTIDPEDFQKVINRHLKKMGLPTKEKLIGGRAQDDTAPAPTPSPGRKG